MSENKLQKQLMWREGKCGKGKKYRPPPMFPKVLRNCLKIWKFLRCLKTIIETFMFIKQFFKDLAEMLSQHITNYNVLSKH